MQVCFAACVVFLLFFLFLFIPAESHIGSFMTGQQFIFCLFMP
jgi:hypothetical protein